MTTVTGFIGSTLAGWWDVMCDGLTDPRHRFTFRDLLTGHCSIGRQAFAALGGFDPSLRCHEDFDFGVRAIAAGMAIRFVPGSDAVHHDASDLDKILARKFDEGIADVQLASKHPTLVTALPLGRPLADAPFAEFVHSSALRHGVIGRSMPAVLRTAMAVFEQVSMRDKWRTALERAMDVSYWRGVACAAGGADAVRALRAVRPASIPPLEVNLADGLLRAEAVIDARRPAALRLTMGPHLVGELAAMPGAEPLRGVHLRPLLLKAFAGALASAFARAGVLPPVFHAAIGEPPVSSGGGDSGLQRGCAA